MDITKFHITFFFVIYYEIIYQIFHIFLYGKKTYLLLFPSITSIIILIYMVSHKSSDENYIMAIHRRGYHIVPSLMTSRLFSPVMHTWIISALVLMVAWKFDYGYTNEGLLFAPLYLLTTIGEMTTKIVSPSDKKLGCIVASLSHLWGGCTIFMLSFNSGRLFLIIGFPCWIIVLRLFSYVFEFHVRDC
ncbi:hypothetical protein AtNW77_Chr1g0076361 [Arabidopsis thaliana]